MMKRRTRGFLTPKQKAILDFIHEFGAKNGFSPSQQEIAKNFGFKSLGTVQNYLVRLESQGALRKTWNGKRAMEVVKPKASAPSVASATVPLPLLVALPLLGRVAAGRPIEAIQNDETIEVPASMIKTGNHFVLRVTGDSMIEDGILGGDYVVIKSQKVANNGQTVVALLGNEATIKRYYKKSDRIELHPANPAYQPLIIDSLVDTQEFKIEGVMVGLIRKLD
jgi:repressor LexA